MTYYRRTYAPVLWGIGIALAIAAALVFAHRASLAHARADERTRITAEGDALLREALAHGQRLAAERDSLRAVVAHVDTVLVTRIRTVQDTAWRTDTNPRVVLGRCLAALDSLATDCDTYRRTATTALAQADTIARRDSAVIAGLSLRLATQRRADSIALVQAQRRPGWKIVGGALVTGVLIGVLK